MVRNVINGKKLKKSRTTLSMSRKSVCNVINRENGWNISPQVLSNWENGARPQIKYRKAMRAYIKRIASLASVSTPSSPQGKKNKAVFQSKEFREKMSRIAKHYHAHKNDKKVMETKSPVTYKTLHHEPILVKRTIEKYWWLGRQIITEVYA